ncbi:unnamed protein product, partial [Owenia fusiformis]
CFLLENVIRFVIEMSLFVTVCWLFLGLGLLSHTVNGIDFKGLLKILGSVTPDEILSKEAKAIQGRSGFEQNTDLCFIVQISCPSNKRVLNKIIEDINRIISNVGNQSCYTIIIYSKTAKKFIDWTDAKKQLIKKFKPPRKCDDCQAQLPTALDLCKKQLKEKNENSRDIVPDVIVTYTDGLSFISKFDKTYQITTVIPKLLEVKQCPNTAGRAFKVGDYSYASDEWTLLEFDNTNILNYIHIKNLNINPHAVEIPAVEGITKEGDPIICPHCCNADVVIIIDRSESILLPDIENVLKFFEDFIMALKYKILPLAPPGPGLRFAILTYNCPVYIHCHLGANNHTGLIKCVKGIPHATGKYTNTADALKEAHKQFSLYGRNSVEVREIVIIATDGRTWECNARTVSDPPTATIAAAKDLKDAGKEIYVYGLPNHKGLVDGCKREWIHVASDPKACHIIDFTEGTFSEEDLLLGGTHLVKEI